MAKHRRHLASKRGGTILAAGALVCGVIAIAPLIQTGAANAANDYKDGRIVAWDDFGRSSIGSLGIASTGGTYTSTNNKVLSVSNAAAHINGLALGSSDSSYLPATSVADVNVVSTAQVGAINHARSGFYYGYQLRRQPNGDNYQPRIIVNDGGSVNLGAVVVHGGQQTALGEIRTGLRLSSGDKVDFQAMLTGSSSVSIIARAWIHGTQPPAWSSFSDKSSSAIKTAGSLGFTAYQSSNGYLQNISVSALHAWELIPSGQTAPSAPAAPPVASTSNPAPTGATSPPSGTGMTSAPPPPPTTGSGPPSPPVSLPPGQGASGLDATGKTVPDTNYAIPAGAVFLSTAGSDSNKGTITAPVATLARAIAIVPSGGTIVVRGGVYRQGEVHAGNAFTLQAYPHEQVWFDGTNVLPASNWKSDGSGHWFTDWSTPTFCGGQYYSRPWNSQNTNNSGPCTHIDMSRDADNPAAGDPQMAYVGGVAQHEVTSLAQATSGKFYYDQNAHRLYVSANPATATIELAARPNALVLGGSGQRILGIGFRRFASNEYVGNQTVSAVYVGATNTTFANDVFTQNAGEGLVVQPRGAVVDNSVFAANGFDGMGGNGHTGYDLNPADNYDGFTVTNSVFNNNNAEHFGTGCDLSCSDAGVKIAHVNGYLFKGDIFSNNVGHGLWCDNNCINGQMVENLAYNNTKSGILSEVSSHGVIASNLIYNNGANGLRVAAATTQIYNNTLINNGGSASIWIYDDPRYPGNSGGVSVGPDSTSDVIENNVISGSNDLIRVEGRSRAGTNTVPSQIIANIDHNAYYRTGGAGQNTINWFTPQGNTQFKSMGAFTRALGFDAHSTEQDGAATPATRVQGAAPLPADVASLLGLGTTNVSSVGAIKYPGK